MESVTAPNTPQGTRARTPGFCPHPVTQCLCFSLLGLGSRCLCKDLSDDVPTEAGKLEADSFAVILTLIWMKPPSLEDPS